MSESELLAETQDADIAVIGLAGRFPGAKTIEEFWQNLVVGKESISYFSDEELLSTGVAPQLLQEPNFVKAGFILEDIDKFDAAFFGFTPREAEIMDPQQRLYLECAMEVLENAGYSSDEYKGMVGVYGGTTLSSYFFNIYSQRQNLSSLDPAQIGLGNSPDFLTTTTSYKLDLHGPSYTVQTACSSSLVAVHIAREALLNGECDIALAGGVSVKVPQVRGYLYQEGNILSPDGHCRAFDANAQGTNFGNGVGIVALKRLEEAIADGDYVHAVIKGSAINNDGALKAGFTAPSVKGQSDVILEAQANAGISADSISYVETHGTGTSLGDPIEIRALTEAFRASTNQRRFCALGSVKTNLGHLDAAAGITGFIKTVLALESGTLPASLNFEEPNASIDFEASPFYVQTSTVPWKKGGASMCRGELVWNWGH